MQESLPLLSIVVPTRNRARLLDECLVSLCSQNYPSELYEIIVVDDGSRAGEAEEVVKKFQDRKPTVHYLRQPPRGLNAARNLGLVESKGDPIIFVDDDVEAPPGWLTALTAASQRYPNAAALGGPAYVRIEGQGSLPRTCAKCARVETIETFSHGECDQPVTWVIGANMAIRRGAVNCVRLFNESFTYGGGDEVEWQVRARQAGMVVMYVAEAWLWHRRTPKDMRIKLLKKGFLRNKWYIRLLLETGEKLPSLKRALGATILSIAHALQERCFLGIFRAAENLGFIVGWVRWGMFCNRK